MDTANDKRAKDLSRTARAEASAWIVKLHGPHRTPELEAALRAWLAASPENAREFEQVTEVWDAGAARVPGVPRVARDSDKIRPRRWLLAAAMILVACGAGSWGAEHLLAEPPVTSLESVSSASSACRTGRASL